MPTVWLRADTLTYPEGGGHLWVYLNWASGFKSAGCEVVWLETVKPDLAHCEIDRLHSRLRCALANYGLGDSIALCSEIEGGSCPMPDGAVPLELASEADLLVNMSYSSPGTVVDRFRRRVLLDIDPGLLQGWIREGSVELPRHDAYFTTGENVDRTGASFPAEGIEWFYLPQSVSLEHWKPVEGNPDAPFTTVSHWEAPSEWVVFGDESYRNDKRSGFLPYLSLPQYTGERLELAICQAADSEFRLDPYEQEEKDRLLAQGWNVVHSHAVSGTPWKYQSYIARSKGEFSCVKPSCVRLQNAWISDRTLCYLATGRPAVVEHTGPSHVLPDRDGLLRFRTVAEAAECLRDAAADYSHHCLAARALVEEFFDARRNAGRLLERALEPKTGRSRRRSSRNSPKPPSAVTRTVAVLGYHKIGAPSTDAWDSWYYVPEEIFERQLQFLKDESWTVLSLADFIAALEQPDTLPARAALITFDDGYRSVLTCAAPHMRRFGFSGVAFVPTSLVGDASRFDENSSEPVEAICSWDELRQLDSQGISVQSHAERHRTSSELSARELRLEAERSKIQIEENLGRSVSLLAYPYGDEGSQPQATAETLRAVGYRAAFLFGGGTQHFPADEVMRLNRIPMWRDTDMAEALNGSTELERSFVAGSATAIET